MKKLTLLLALVLGFALAACGSAQTPVLSDPLTANKTPQPTLSPKQSTVDDMTRTDVQGAITIEVIPQNLSNPGDTLIFEIGMNTHSVDLSMDLASLATLTTDNGRTVQATLWDAPRGGHHVSGTLSFPANVDGGPVLNGAKQLTLTVKDVDAPQRVFTWDLQK